MIFCRAVVAAAAAGIRGQLRVTVSTCVDSGIERRSRNRRRVPETMGRTAHIKGILMAADGQRATSIARCPPRTWRSVRHSATLAYHVRASRAPGSNRHARSLARCTDEYRERSTGVDESRPTRGRLVSRFISAE